MSFIQSLHVNSQSPVRARGDFSPEFMMRISVGHDLPIHLFFIEMVTKLSLPLGENSGIHICSDRNLSDIEYTCYNVLLIEDSS